MEKNKIAAYEAAIENFQTIPEWEDAEEQIASCKRKIEEKAKKRKKVALIATPVVGIAIVFIILLSTVVLPQMKLDEAKRLIAKEKYEEAYNLLEGLNYKDSEKKLDEIKVPYQIELISKAKVGSNVTFGAYEQDNNTSNGKEDIEWIVIEKDGNKALLISKYALDGQVYNTELDWVTWETCSFRKWLNETFLTEAFGETEQKVIQTTTVTADQNPQYDTNPGNATADKVFLLSISEAEKYFTSDEQRKCVPTQYALQQGVYTDDDYKVDDQETCRWWLRSPGQARSFAADVDDGGAVDTFGLGADFFFFPGVRPAIWINLK